MSLLTLSVSLPGLKPPLCHQAIVEDSKKASTLQLAVFFGALNSLAVGSAAPSKTFRPSALINSMISIPRRKLVIYPSSIGGCSASSLGHFANTVLVYIQDNVGRPLGYGVPTLGLMISVLIFLAGTAYYGHRVPAGSPFARMALVIVATIRKWKVSLPSDSKELYELDLEEYARKGKFRIDLTSTPRFLKKVAVETGSMDP